MTQAMPARVRRPNERKGPMRKIIEYTLVFLDGIFAGPVVQRFWATGTMPSCVAAWASCCPAMPC